MTGRWFGALLPCRFASFLRFLTLSALPAVPVLSAQTTARAEGRVILPDSSGVAGVRVVLHRVGQQVQGPLDSVLSATGGHFRFRFRADTAALYLLSARRSGIEYFSPPVNPRAQRPDTSLRIVVYDTSSTEPIGIEARHIVIARPGDDGSRTVLDLIVLRNDGTRTRIASDSSRPSWVGPLLAGTMGLELGESDVSPDAVTRRGDSVYVTAPLAPGEKQLTLEYLIPAGREVLDLPFTSPVPMLNVLTEESGAIVSGGTVAAADSQELQGRSFRRWTGDVPTGSALRVTLPGRGRAPEWLLAVLVGTVGLVLAGAAWYVLWSSGRTPTLSTAELLDAVAQLDARYRGRETETSVDEWSTYQSERARLKAQLETSLAAEGRNR
jgi:hypothetical protein